MERVDHEIIKTKAVEVFQSEGLDKFQSETVVEGLIWSTKKNFL